MIASEQAARGMMGMTDLGECAGCGEVATVVCSNCDTPWCSDCEADRVHTGTCLPDAQLVRAALAPIEHFNLHERKDPNGDPWPSGEWDEEPDAVEWIENGWRCLIVRHGVNGHLNGYVGVPIGHAAHGLADNELNLQVHGGVTYASPNAPASWLDELTVVTTPGLWWVGFDTGHLTDKSPGLERFIGGVGSGGTYKTVDYCRAEIVRMIYELEEMERSA